MLRSAVPLLRVSRLPTHRRFLPSSFITTSSYFRSFANTSNATNKMASATSHPSHDLGNRNTLDLSLALDPTAKDIVSLIREEHTIVLNLFDRYKNSNSDIEKQALGYNLIKLLCIHSAKEEMVLYPTLREKLPNGNQIADDSLVEHLALKKDLYELDQLGSSATLVQIDAKVQAALTDLTTHLEHEEENILTQLPKYVSSQELIALRDSFVRHLAMAPSRPHPDAPDKPPMNIAANTASVPLDAAKDMLRFSSTKPTKDDLLSGNVLDPSATSRKV